MALGGQAVALHRVGEDHRRPGVVDRARTPSPSASQVVPAQVAHRGVQGVVVQPGDQRGQLRVARRRAAARAAASGGAAQQPLVLRVGHVVDALRAARRRPGRVNSSSSSRPYLTVSTCQPAAANMPCSRVAPMLGTTRSSDCRFRSTIQTTSPSSPTIGSRIASQHAPSSSSASPTSEYCRPCAAVSAGDEPVRRDVDVAAGQRAPDRRGGADADRAGRVVDRVGVLGPARVALQPAERAQRRQVALVQLAEQVVDRVQHRRGVRLDRHPVPAAAGARTRARS